MNLIADTGIQLYTPEMPLEVDLKNPFKLFFHEWLENENEHKLGIVHYFEIGDKWVWYRDLLRLGLKNVSLSVPWEDVEKDYDRYGYRTIDASESDCFEISLSNCDWAMFENKWLPFPYFELDPVMKNFASANTSFSEWEFGPTHWCRVKLIPETHPKNKKTYRLLLAFDTRTETEKNEYNESPVFTNESMDFELCGDLFTLVDFCSKAKKCEWVDMRIHDLFFINNNSNVMLNGGIDNTLRYLAKYIFIVKYIQQQQILPKITLFQRSRQERCVDLIIDIGNSRTCGMLFDRDDMTKVEMVGLQDFTRPIKDGELTRYKEAFDMQLAFREADLGGEFIIGSKQFVFPSFVRLGKEAAMLINETTDLDKEIEKNRTFSSPKHYVWDNKPQQKPWGYVVLKQETDRQMWIEGISNYIQSDGTINHVSGNAAHNTNYSRKTLMTLAYLEIIAQSEMQVNSYSYRNSWGDEQVMRRIDRVIISCPTTMSREEQTFLRKCAEDAIQLLYLFYGNTNRQTPIVLPSYRKKVGEEWIYDEATCAQFVFLYSEISKRYLNNVRDYFELFGKKRNDLGDYEKKSLTVGSVDIGAGTTDVMVAAYQYDDANMHCRLTPVPLFWESFYSVAGDHLLKEMIRQLIIEEADSALAKKLKEVGREKEASDLNFKFFGEDTAEKTVPSRQLRNKFNLQVSMPVVQHFLELVHTDEMEKEVRFDDIFKDNRPTKQVLDHFKNHFGFSVEDIVWLYKRDVVSKIIEKTFDGLAGKISMLLAYYGCDFVVLSGRPSSLKPLADLFLKYYPVPPNRLIALNDYRVGNWYPAKTRDGTIENTKSVVVIGAMLGCYGVTMGKLSGFSFDLDVLKDQLLPTSNYFYYLNNPVFPVDVDSLGSIMINTLPVRIDCRQFDNASYPSRPMYKLDYDVSKPEAVINRIKGLMPLEITLQRDPVDREKIKITDVTGINGDHFLPEYFTLHIQSISEDENHWLDTGIFTNLKR